MFRELLSLFRSDNAISVIGDDFNKMLDLTHDLTMRAGSLYFDGPNAEESTEISRRDVKVNKLERRIRKKVIAHVALASNAQDAPYCLLLMSLVKDAERLGDYAKNLAEVYDDGGGPRKVVAFNFDVPRGSSWSDMFDSLPNKESEVSDVVL